VPAKRREASNEHRERGGEHSSRKSHPPIDASETALPFAEKKVEYLTAQQVAEVLQISEATVHRLRRSGRIPAVMLTDRLIRFNLRDVQRALRPNRRHEDQTEEQPGEAGPSPQLSFDDFDSKFDE